jgi:hypothetical protein
LYGIKQVGLARSVAAYHDIGRRREFLQVIVVIVFVFRGFVVMMRRLETPKVANDNLLDMHLDSDIAASSVNAEREEGD